MNAPFKPQLPSIVESLSFPSFVPVQSNLLAAKFDLMNFTPAKRILDDALARGALQRGGHVIESSSGTFALALSILCSLYNLKLRSMPPPMNPSPSEHWKSNHGLMSSSAR